MTGGGPDAVLPEKKQAASRLRQERTHGKATHLLRLFLKGNLN